MPPSGNAGTADTSTSVSPHPRSAPSANTSSPSSKSTPRTGEQTGALRGPFRFLNNIFRNVLSVADRYRKSSATAIRERPAPPCPRLAPFLKMGLQRYTAMVILKPAMKHSIPISPPMPGTERTVYAAQKPMQSMNEALFFRSTADISAQAPDAIRSMS